MTIPNLVKGQIALDPTNDLLYYVNESNTIVSTSLSWVKNNSDISTAENVVISGDLTVSGSTVTVNVETLLIEDNIIVLNTGTTGSPSLNAGVEVERGTSTNVQLRWNESTDKWQFTNDGTTFYNIIGEGNDITANVAGTLTGNVVGNVAGNADTATKLATARTIQLTGPVTGSASFDGSSSISISTSLTSESTTIENLSDVTISSAANGDFLRYNGSAWINDAVDLGTDTTGNFVSDVTSGNGITVTHTPGEGSSAAVAVDTSVVATLNDSQILTNKTLATPTFTGVSPKITLGGDLYGNVTLANLQNGTLDAYLLPESVTLGVQTSGDYVSRLYAGVGVEIQFDSNSAVGSNATLSIGQSVSTGATPNFVSVTAQNFYGNVTGDLAGNLTGNVYNATDVNTTNLSVNSFGIDPTGA
jgi:hypothetical protein